MEKRNLIFGLAAIALLALVVIDPTFAQDSTSGGQGAGEAGSTALGTLSNAITGNLGLLLGLGITILGLWTWIIGQKTGAGITMILGGVLLTLAPGLFNGARNMIGGVVDQFSGGNTATVDTTISN
jgi:hypothetical protein